MHKVVGFHMVKGFNNTFGSHAGHMWASREPHLNHMGHGDQGESRVERRVELKDIMTLVFTVGNVMH